MNATSLQHEGAIASETAALDPVEIRYADFRFSWWHLVAFAVVAWLTFGLERSLLPPIVMFVLCAAYIGIAFYTHERFKHAGPALVIDHEGLHWTPYESEPLDARWGEIDFLTLGGEHGRGGPYIGIRLKHPEQRFPERRFSFHGSRMPHLLLRTEGLQLSTKALIARIQAYEATLQTAHRSDTSA